MPASKSAILGLLALMGTGGFLEGADVVAPQAGIASTSFGDEPAGTWRFSLQSSFQFLPIPAPAFLVVGRVERNPIRYKLATQVLSARYLPGEIRGTGWLRGRIEVSANIVGSIIIAGPESYFIGFAPGLRYYFTGLGMRWLPYIELAGGPGATDSSGRRYGQQQDLTFTYLLGVGAKGRLSRATTFTISLLDQHISNAYLTRPNYGFDSVGLAISLSRSF